MPYRTRTYIAADWDGDKDAVEQLQKWNKSEFWSLSFPDAHELQQSRDTSLPCSIKKSLKERMDRSNRFVLIVGEHTDALIKGSCALCGSYNSWTKSCARQHAIYSHSYSDYECDDAMRASIDIVVLDNDIRVDRTKCPGTVRWKGEHVAMMYYKDGNYYWDYQAVKRALG